MQTRIARGPHATLGVESSASPDQVRGAFLELTKQFHPARFGRLSVDVQRLSNEVFLGIKLAHDTLLRSLGAPTRPGSMARTTSGGMPVVTAEGSAKFPAHEARAKTGQMPPIRDRTGPLPPVRDTR